MGTVPKYSILAVDDSKVILRVLEMSLQDLAVVKSVTSLAEVKQALAQQTFHLLIVDYRLDLESGLEVIAEVRQHKSPYELPALLVSASLDASLQFNALKAGANDCIRKPLDKQRLHAMVERLLQAPYIAELPQGFVEYTELNWSADGVFYTYCPELNERVSAPTQEEAHSLIEQRIAAELAQGKSLGLTEPQIRRYSFQTSQG